MEAARPKLPVRYTLQRAGKADKRIRGDCAVAAVREDSMMVDAKFMTERRPVAAQAPGADVRRRMTVCRGIFLMLFALSFLDEPLEAEGNLKTCFRLVFTDGYEL